MLNLVSFKSSTSSENAYTDELFDVLGELILQMRYDYKDNEFASSKSIKNPHFNIFLKEQYKLNSSSPEGKFKSMTNKSLTINFYLQKKENGFSLLVESWNFYFIKAKNDGRTRELSNLSRARICLFLRSILCLLTNLPLWGNFILLNETSQKKNEYFLDHEFLLDAKEKKKTNLEAKGYKENFLEVETEKFFLLFRVSFFQDFSFLSNNSGVKKPKSIITKFKRERFLSEGTTNEENCEETPVRFFAKWGIESGDNIFHKKLNNHFKIAHKENKEIFPKFEKEKNEKTENIIEKSQKISETQENQHDEIEIEVIDSDQDFPHRKISSFDDEEDENNQFELITEETEIDKKIELKKNNSDYMIIGNDNVPAHKNNDETVDKIITKCRNCLKKFTNSFSETNIIENMLHLKGFLSSIDKD